jgi:hypothetical protein
MSKAPYEGPTRADVLAVFEALSERGYGNESASAEELTDLFCEELLKRHADHVVGQVSWGYQ